MGSATRFDLPAETRLCCDIRRPKLQYPLRVATVKVGEEEKVDGILKEAVKSWAGVPIRMSDAYRSALVDKGAKLLGIPAKASSTPPPLADCVFTDGPKETLPSGEVVNAFKTFTGLGAHVTRVGNNNITQENIEKHRPAGGTPHCGRKKEACGNREALPSHHNARLLAIARHHAVCDNLAELCRGKGYEVEREKAFPHFNKRADLVVLTIRGVAILEIEVVEHFTSEKYVAERNQMLWIAQEIARGELLWSKDPECDNNQVDRLFQWAGSQAQDLAPIDREKSPPHNTPSKHKGESNNTGSSSEEGALDSHD
uniref:Uncharacterized protein n=1 Tax=Branchiostoma floridae TaxID=7739 RepID=C3Y9Q8_BRAFL|eukprot:XP_002607304.1 hypothetical protein BRAFLDRAFT_88254 [Branchiostoma floridae]